MKTVPTAIAACRALAGTAAAREVCMPGAEMEASLRDAYTETP